MRPEVELTRPTSVELFDQMSLPRRVAFSRAASGGVGLRSWEDKLQYLRYHDAAARMELMATAVCRGVLSKSQIHPFPINRRLRY